VKKSSQREFENINWVSFISVMKTL